MHHLLHLFSDRNSTRTKIEYKTSSIRKIECMIMLDKYKIVIKMQINSYSNKNVFMFLDNLPFLKIT